MTWMLPLLNFSEDLSIVWLHIAYTLGKTSFSIIMLPNMIIYQKKKDWMTALLR